MVRRILRTLRGACVFLVSPRARACGSARVAVTRCWVKRAIAVACVRGQARGETNPRFTFARPWRSANARMGTVTATWVWNTRRTEYANSKCAFRVGRGEWRRRKVNTGRDMGRGMVKNHSCKRVVNPCEMGVNMCKSAQNRGVGRRLQTFERSPVRSSLRSSVRPSLRRLVRSTLQADASSPETKHPGQQAVRGVVCVSY